MEISDHTLLTLEFDKVRSLIADRTVSTLGREEIEALKPSDDLDIVQARMRPVLETMDLIAFDDPLSVSSLPDIRSALQASTVPGTILTISELLEIGQILLASRRLLAYLDKRMEKYPDLWSIVSTLSEQPWLEEAFQTALDPATESVKDSASLELRRIRRSIDQTKSSIRERVEAILAKLPDDVVQDRLVTLRGGRYVIPVKENQKNRMNGLVHDQSSSGATLFIEPMATVELNNKLRQLELAEQQEVKRILRQLSESVAQTSDQLSNNFYVLCRFDALFAKAGYCRSLDATEPEFNNKGLILLMGAKHPLLVQRFQEEDKTGAVVPLDISLGDESYWTLILTGPNAGGKTVALKTLGLLALMAQSGLPIPALPRSQLPVFPGIFADIGDAQSIENDLSTFSSHISNLVEICRGAHRDSLVLLDEIGSSTDPDQGSALAMALLQELTARGSRTIATTHHGALKAFAHSTNGISNGSMAFDANTLQPTFQLRLKVPGSSYAFEIARRLKMPGEIVDEAEKIAGSDVGRVESLIAELDETYQRYTEELELAEKNRCEMEELREEYVSRVEDVDRREHELKHGARQEAQQILADANALVERTVRELRENKADRGSIKKAHATLAGAKKEMNTFLKEPEPDLSQAELQPGDSVWVSSFGKEGRIISLREGSSRTLVEIGKVRVELSLADLESKQPDSDAATDGPSAEFKARSDIDTNLDLRGMTSDEALEATDKYVDELYLGRVENATIIHGKGTGTLRKVVSAFLNSHNFIKSQRLGKYGEGGTGVTIVTLHLDRN
jgi:DNA mismatch repair protein MutS2